MFIKTVSISNFRRLDGLTLDLEGEDVIVTGGNGAGKTSLLTAIAGALGRPVSLGRDDFLDPTAPIEVRVVLGGLVIADQQVFGDRVTFAGSGGSAQLSVGLMSTWDDDTERADSRCGFPTSSWQALSRVQREALPVLWLPSWRDAARLLSVAARASFLAELLRGVDLAAANTAAAGHLADAVTDLTSSSELADALDRAAAQLGRVLPGVGTNALSLLPGAEQDLWASLRLAIEYEGPRTQVQLTSSGLAQASIFAVVLELLATQGRIVLVTSVEVV